MSQSEWNTTEIQCPKVGNLTLSCPGPYPSATPPAAAACVARYAARDAAWASTGPGSTSAPTSDAVTSRGDLLHTAELVGLFDFDDDDNAKAADCARDAGLRHSGLARAQRPCAREFRQCKLEHSALAQGRARDARRPPTLPLAAARQRPRPRTAGAADPAVAAQFAKWPGVERAEVDCNVRRSSPCPKMNVVHCPQQDPGALDDGAPSAGVLLGSNDAVGSGCTVALFGGGGGGDYDPERRGRRSRTEPGGPPNFQREESPPSRGAANLRGGPSSEDQPKRAAERAGGPPRFCLPGRKGWDMSSVFQPRISIVVHSMAHFGRGM